MCYPVHKQGLSSNPSQCLRLVSQTHTSGSNFHGSLHKLLYLPSFRISGGRFHHHKRSLLLTLSTVTWSSEPQIGKVISSEVEIWLNYEADVNESYSTGQTFFGCLVSNVGDVWGAIIEPRIRTAAQVQFL